MLCKRCNMKMKSGTRYEKRGGIKSNKYNECPRCHERKYINRLDFKRIFDEDFTKK